MLRLLMSAAAFTALIGVDSLDANVSPPSDPQVDRTLKGDKLVNETALKSDKLALSEPRKTEPAQEAPGYVIMLNFDPVEAITRFDEESNKEPDWPKAQLITIVPPKAHRLRKAHAVQSGIRLPNIPQSREHDYTLDYLLYDPVAERKIDIGVGVTQMGIAFGVPVAGPFIAAGIGTGRCNDRETRYQLSKLAREDRRLGRTWTKENADANVQLVSRAVFPYCLPVIGGLLRAGDAMAAGQPLGVFLGLGGSVLDASLVAPIPQSVTLPLVGAEFVGPRLQSRSTGASHPQPAARYVQVKKSKKVAHK